MPLPLLLTLVTLASTTPAADAARVSDTRIKGIRGGPLIGLSDNRPEALLDRRFQASRIKRVRLTVPFDQIARGGARLRLLDWYFGAAKDQGIEPLVSFYRSSASRRLLPSPASFRRHFRRFRERYPWVRTFSTWNEANFPAAQPTGNHPRRTAQFYNLLRRECAGGRCTVLTADFRADGSSHSAWWLREFKRSIGGGRHIWGLVSHPDVNRQSTDRTRAFLRATRGPVWATEIGAVNFFGKGFRPNLRRQTSAMRYLMTRYPRVSKRLDRMYIYHWQAAPGNRQWDSALLNVRSRPRPAYYIFFRAIGRRAP